MNNNIQHIVIIGGGFAGIELAKKMAGNNQYRITLIDKNNYNFFPPLIYQVATGFLETSSISYPFRKLFSGVENVFFRMGEVVAVDSKINTVFLDNGEVKYDHLVIATGTTTNYFGNENVKRFAQPMKTMDDALNLRNTMLQKLELASITPDNRERQLLQTVVIAGGGPTGVELAGMFAEMSRSIIRKEYPELKEVPSNIFLVDGVDRLLAPMSERSQNYTLKTLHEMGVQVKLNALVTDYDGTTVHFKDGTTIQTRNLIWAAGVTGRVFDGIPETSYGRGKRILTNSFNQAKDLQNVYALGDACIMEGDAQYPNGHPQIAQVALQQATTLAKNFKQQAEGKPWVPFKYVDKGSMAIIGKAKAVADLPKNTFLKGFIAWVIWLFVHIMSLLTYRNRVATLWHWTQSYFTSNPSLRMIVRPKENLYKNQKGVLPD